MNHDDTGNKVFLSYSSEDRGFADDLAKALQAKGYPVWWDVDIPAGVHYPKFIEAALKSAGCVVVIWSRHSVESRWVRNEADWGAENGALVPIRIDDADLPWEFRNFQTLDLSHWTGDTTDPVFTKLLHGLDMNLAESREPAAERSEESGKPESAAVTRAARQPGRRWLGAAAVLLLAAAIYLVLPWLRGPDAPTAETVAARDLSFTPLTGDGRTRSSALSPDGRYVVYTRSLEDRMSLRLKQIDTGNESVLVDADQQGIRSPIFSPDGVYVFFAMTGPSFGWSNSAEYDLYRISMLGGNPHLIATDIIGRRFGCSPDGKRITYKRNDGDTTVIWTADIDGSDERRITAGRRDDSTHNCLAWSADGAEIVSAVRDTVAGQIDLVAYPVDGGESRVLPGGQWQAVMDIYALADESGTLVVGKPVATIDLNINLWLLEDGASRLAPLTNDMTSYYQVSADRSGRDMVLNHYAVKRTLRVFPIDDPERHHDVSTDVVPNGRVIWAANDDLLVNQRIGERVGLVYMALDDGTTRQVATDVDWIADMALSPDGTRLAYRSFQGSDQWIWLANADGGSPRLLTEEGCDEFAPQFTPDGRWLVYAHRDAPDKPYYIWKRSLDDDTKVRLSDVQGGGPVVSPDGLRIAAHFVDDRTGNSRLALILIDGGEPDFLELPDTYGFLCWNPTGSGLTCMSREEGRLVLWDVPLSGTPAHRLMDFAAEQASITDAAWSPSGESLALCLQFVAFDALLLQRPGAGR